MEDEMEEMMGEAEEGLSSLQIDLNYEYSAPRFYDFTGMGTADDSREAEAWFDNAGSDPDSPYLAKLLHMREAIVDEEGYLPQAHDVEHCDLIHHLAADSRPSMGTEISMMDEDRKGNMQGTFLMEQPADLQIMEKSADSPVGYIQNLSEDTCLDRLVMDCNVADSFKEFKVIVSKSHNGKDAPKGKDKAVLAAPFSRSSTLMKPTASQLAKQKKTTLSGISKNKKDTDKACLNECHASKRQKLEGGQLWKDTHVDGTREQAKLRLTVPREPELKTAQRARRMRANTASNLDECELTKASLFKAQPLNRKVLEAPSLPLPQRSARRMPVFHEFHLKTSERALQHSLAVSSTGSCANPLNVQDGPTAAGRSDPAGTRPVHLNKVGSYPRSGQELLIAQSQTSMRKAVCLKQDRSIGRSFRAREILVFTEISNEKTTKPVGFNFPTDKRFPPPNPPIELFNKLSLRSEVRHHNASQTAFPHTSHSPLKTCRREEENVKNMLQQEHNMVMCTGEEKQNMSHMQLNEIKEGGGIAEMSKGQLLSRSPFTEMLEVNMLSSRPSCNGSLLVAQNS